MKKYLFAISLIFFSLYACGCNETTDISEKEQISDVIESAEETMAEHEDEQICEWSYEKTYYKNTSDVELANTASDTDKLPLKLKWDEEAYELNHIAVHSSGYEYSMKSVSNNKNVIISVCTNDDMEQISEVRAVFGNKYSETVKIKNGDKQYDILLSSPEYGDIRNYSIIYLPEKGYRASIHVGNETTKEEILSYFDDFELVADN